ncbi:MAG: hypothetical protein JNM96_02850 [Bacteroidia bacterium]|nr:hypothetical protein [Bacteroidia bacterium]
MLMGLRIKTLFLLLTSVALFAFTLKHPFYLGVTQIKHNSSNNNLEVSVKLFVNDLEDALKKINKKQIDLLNGKDSTYLNQVINQYLLSHLKLKANTKLLQQKYLGYEIEKDVIWIYAEYKSEKIIGTLQIENTLLYDYLAQQTNIMRFEYGGKEHHAKLNNPEKLATIKP